MACSTTYCYLEHLSDDVLLHILQFVPKADWYNLSQVSYRIKNVCHDKEIFRQVFCSLTIEQVSLVLLLFCLGYLLYSNCHKVYKVIPRATDQCKPPAFMSGAQDQVPRFTGLINLGLYLYPPGRTNLLTNMKCIEICGPYTQRLIIDCLSKGISP